MEPTRTARRIRPWRDKENYFIYEFDPPLTWWHPPHTSAERGVLAGYTRFALVVATATGLMGITPCDEKGELIVHTVVWEDEHGQEHTIYNLSGVSPVPVLDMHEVLLARYGYSVRKENQDV